jgi:hypothetical protein
VVEHAVAQKHPARMPVPEVEEVAVDARRRRRRGDAALDVAHAFASEDRLVREQRRERVETARLRRIDDVHDDGTVRRELDVAHVRDAGHQQ